MTKEEKQELILERKKAEKKYKRLNPYVTIDNIEPLHMTEHALNNKNDVEFIFKQNYALYEDANYVPRFSLKDIEIFKDIPINKPIKYSQNVMTKAIKYGMIFLVNYKGEKDNQIMGHERVIYPMVLGRSAKGDILLRGWHLDGWSVSNNRHVKKIWRMFRVDRILSMTFTGSFYRLAPEGYNMNDKGMRGGIITKADFNQIRRNQQTLVNQQKIQDREEVTLGDKDGGSKFVTIKVTSTDTILDLNEPFENAYINEIDDIDSVKITFMKSIYGNTYVAILGALGDPKHTVKVLDGNKNIGVFKVLDGITGDVLKKIKRITGNTEYDLYVFESKLGA